MRCKYCQNYEISQLQKGKEISVEHLAEIFLKQQERGANNINLVTPTSYVYQIVEALDIAKKNGLTIPIVYNTNIMKLKHIVYNIFSHPFLLV